LNKLIKGSIAAAAGIVLLLGGAGSLALWNDAASIDAGTVNSGTLTIDSNLDGAWDQSLDYIVPGDNVTYTETFDVVAVGDNLNAELSSNIASIIDGITGSDSTTSFTVVDSANVPVVPVAGVYSFGAGDYTVSVEIEVDFPSSVSGLTGQGETTDLSNVTITLSQV
jgi:alternate signal-mediated exported protein